MNQISLEKILPFEGVFLINRPGVTGAVLQTHLLIIDSLINEVSESSFVKISSKNLHSQTLRARELKF